MKKGANRFAWDMRYPGAETFPGMIIWGGGTGGPLAVSGEYLAELAVGDTTRSVTFKVMKDPRSAATQESLQEQFEFLVQIRDKLTETHLAVRDIRDIKKQLADLRKRVKGRDDAVETLENAKNIEQQLTTIEEALYQTKSKSRQDPLNFPIRLNNRLSALVGVVATGDNRPTDQARGVYQMLTTAIDAELGKLRMVISNDLANFNELLRAKNTPLVLVKPAEAALKKK